MTAFDEYDLEDDEDYDYYDHRGGGKRRMTCARCGADGLHWEEHWNPDGTSRVVLHDDNGRHECRASEDDFEDVS